MADTNETTNDIIAEMNRVEVCADGEPCLRDYARRFEAALKRERAKIEADALAVGGIVEAERTRERLLTKTAKNVTSGAASDTAGNNGDEAKLLKTVDLRFDICRNIEQVLEIGREFQNKDGYRGAHYDTVKLLCDAIEYQQEQLKTKTEVGDAAKLREALLCIGHIAEYLEAGTVKDLNHAYRNIQDRVEIALAEPPRYCDVMSLESARKLWFVKEIVPRLDGDLPLGKEIPFEEWFVSKLEKET